jgi:1-acyl-sn-glycerol-3-phosphate acyltransferase
LIQTMTGDSSGVIEGAGMGDTQSIHPLASLLAGFARLISGVRVRWLDCEPSARQRIYFANHTSHLDAVVLWAALPDGVRAVVRPVAARDYWEKGRLRRYLSQRVFHAILINRDPQSSERSLAAAKGVIANMVEAMGDRFSLLVFPEGTRGSGDDVTLFKSGLYHLALGKPGAELVPAYLENLNRALPKGEVLPVPVLSSVTFGPALKLEPDEKKHVFLERAREAVRRLRP